MSEFYNRQGEPITLHEYGTLMADLEYKSVGYDHIGDFLISTAWLGANHNFSDHGKHLIFETMIFESGNSSETSSWQFDNYQTRYATEEEAVAGHAEAIRTVLCKTRVFVNDHQA